MVILKASCMSKIILEIGSFCRSPHLRVLQCLGAIWSASEKGRNSLGATAGCDLHEVCPRKFRAARTPGAVPNGSILGCVALGVIVQPEARNIEVRIFQARRPHFVCHA